MSDTSTYTAPLRTRMWTAVRDAMEGSAIGRRINDALDARRDRQNPDGAWAKIDAVEKVARRAGDTHAATYQSGIRQDAGPTYTPGWTKQQEARQAVNNLREVVERVDDMRRWGNAKQDRQELGVAFGQVLKNPIARETLAENRGLSNRVLEVRRELAEMERQHVPKTPRGEHAQLLTKAADYRQKAEAANRYDSDWSSQYKEQARATLAQASTTRAQSQERSIPVQQRNQQSRGMER